MHVKKGDKVKVIAGKNKGKTGVVSQVFRDSGRVALEGFSTKRHMRPRRQGDKGGIVDIPSTLHASNVALQEKKAKETKKAK